MNPPHSRIIITICIEEDPHTEVLAAQALLRLLEWLRHDGTTEVPPVSRSPYEGIAVWVGH